MDIKELRAAYKTAFDAAQAALTAEPFDAEAAQTATDEAKALQGRIKAFESLGPAPEVEPKKGLVTVVADEEDKKKAVI